MSLISVKANVMGGMPCIVNTRIPIARIKWLVEQGYDAKKLHWEYRYVSVKTFEALLRELDEQEA